jgi:hypothetical protein
VCDQECLLSKGEEIEGEDDKVEEINGPRDEVPCSVVECE